jgi:ankyrin repeat protein
MITKQEIPLAYPRTPTRHPLTNPVLFSSDEDGMGFFSNLFGKSNQPPKPQTNMSPTEKAFWLLGSKSEAAFLETLAKEPAINVNDMSPGASMLSFAISQNLDNAVRAILERKPDLSLADREYGMTALHLAVTKGKVPLVKALLAAGAGELVNKTFGPPKGPQWTCLSTAVKKRQLDMIQILLEAGANADCDLRPDAPAPEDRQVTPLTAAVCNGDLEMMRLLLAHGANVNYWPPSTLTPLMHAALTGQLEAAKLLVENGAVIELHSLQFKANAYTIALHRGHKELAAFLLSRSETLKKAILPTT